jgi:hypothetical protein
MRKEWSGSAGRGLWDNVPIPAEEERRIQAGIDATMRDVIAHPYKNPQMLDPPEKVKVAVAPTVVEVSLCIGGKRRTRDDPRTKL